MERHWAGQLADGQAVDCVYRVVECVAATSRMGDPYLKVTLADCSGEIVAFRFNASAGEIETTRLLRYARVRGEVVPPRGTFGRSLRLHGPLEAVDEPHDLTPFVAISEIPLATLRDRLQRHIASVSDPHLSALLHALFDDPALKREFETRPAAQKMHHAWRHGLLEHTLEVADTVATLCDAQRRWSGEPLSRDLVVTAALLHDLGKVDELRETDCAIDYSEPGQLLGHVTLGILRINAKINRIPDFPPRLRHVLLHLIQSHHGRGEWGSPQPPMTPEALLLHTADHLTVQMRYMQESRAAAGDTAFVTDARLEGSTRQAPRTLFAGDYGVAPDRIGEPRRPGLSSLPRPGGLPILRLVSDEAATGNTFATARLPLVGRIAAGLPLLAEENVEGYHALDAAGTPIDADHFLLQVRGDSMTGDGIVDGDLIVVRRQERGGEEDILVVLVDDEATVKRVRRTHDGVVLLPSNPHHSPIYVAHGSDFHIRGKVVAIAR